MGKFNGQVTLREFKAKAGQLVVLGQPLQEEEWRLALAKAKSWKAAAKVLPSRHPMLAIACGEEV